MLIDVLTEAQLMVRRYEDDPLPGVEALLDGIAKQVEAEKILQKESNAEAMLIHAFIATHITNALSGLKEEKN